MTVSNTLTVFCFLNHHELSFFGEETDTGFEGSGSRRDASMYLSLQLRGIQPLFTKIGAWILMEEKQIHSK